MIYYILQVVFCHVLLVVLYEVLLKKETFFSYNRWYLLAMPLVCLVLPLINIPVLTTAVPSEFIVTLPELTLTASTTIDSKVPSLSLTFAAIWSIGSLLMATRLIRQLIHLKRLISSGKASRKGSVRVVSIPDSNMAFSFLNTIFIGDQLTATHKETILAHEMIHVKDRHGWDLLYFEILKVVFWFNPFIYYFQKKLAAVLEFIADAEVVKTHQRNSYYESLVAQIFQTTNLSFVNTFFNHSLIKKRIIMLQKTPSRNYNRWKYFMVLPALALLFTVFACAQNSDTIQEEHLVADGVTENAAKEKSVGFATLETTPVYPGCEGMSPEENQQCFFQKVAQFIVAEFNTKVADETVEGNQRIVVHFVVNDQGEVEQVKANAPAEVLMQEAIRVTQKLPKMKPGMKEGKAVAVQFALPILFEF